MNRKGGFGDLLWDNVIYLVLLVLFFIGMFIFISAKASGAGIWSEFYGSEIARVIDSAKSGDEIVLDVHKATEIAKDNKVASFSEIFVFDNTNNRVGVKLTPGARMYYSYFKDVDIVDVELELGIYREPAINVLKFKVVEPRRVG